MNALKNLYLFVFLLFAVSCARTGIETEINSKPKNVILLIGDGMGLSQLSSLFYFKEDAVNMSRFTHTGLIGTSSATNKITDSAASGTAFACGEKTYNGAIGVSTDTTMLMNLTELLAGQQMKSGLIATSSITNATPAAFYAHTPSRYQEEEIARQLTDANISFFAGGGLQFFNKRSDHIDYLDTLSGKGYLVDTLGLANPGLQSAHKYGFLLAQNAMTTMTDGRGDFLSRATRLAIEYLSQNEEGFFLMVEGSQIDWACHENDTEYLIAEMIDFDQAVGVAMDFAENDGSTLVVVLADHETGGFTLSPGTGEDMENPNNEIQPSFSTGDHSATLIPVLAFGGGAEDFSGIYENTEIFDRILQALDVSIDRNE
jgi:alkaline phosphatase